MYWFRLSILLFIVCSTIIPISSPPATAQVGQNQPQSTREVKIPAGGVGKLAKELNLSTEQIQRLEKLRGGSKGKTKQRRLALRIAKQELAQLLQGNANSDQVRQKRQQVQILQREISDVNFESTLAIREILNPEQRTKLQQIMQQRQRNRGNLKK